MEAGEVINLYEGSTLKNDLLDGLLTKWSFRVPSKIEPSWSPLLDDLVSNRLHFLEIIQQSLAKQELQVFGPRIQEVATRTLQSAVNASLSVGNVDLSIRFMDQAGQLSLDSFSKSEMELMHVKVSLFKAKQEGTCIEDFQTMPPLMHDIHLLRYHVILAENLEKQSLLTSGMGVRHHFESARLIGEKLICSECDSSEEMSLELSNIYLKLGLFYHLLFVENQQSDFPDVKVTTFYVYLNFV